MVQGTTETKEFYDQVGWDHAAEGVTVDHDLFGVKEDGVLRQRASLTAGGRASTAF